MEKFLQAGLSNAISATFLALLVASLSRVLARRPAILHCLWLLVMLKLVTPPLYEVPISWPVTFSASPEAVASVDPGPIGPPRAVCLLDVAEIQDPEALNAVVADLSVREVNPARVEPTIAENALAAITSAGRWLSIWWMPIVAVVWITGTVATAAISLRRILRFQLLLREGWPGSHDIQDRVDELSANLGIQHPPRLWWIEGKLSPMLWALVGRPRLIIPNELWKTLDERKRVTLLAHELAHLRRGDHRVRIFELAVTALYWWNPVLWWARRSLREVEEQCCDAWVVWAFPESAKSYAETLLETLDFLNHSELSTPLLASGFGRVQHLRRRLTMIMNGTTPRLLSAWGALGALSRSGALLLPVSPTWAQKPEVKQDIRVIVKSDADAKDVQVLAAPIAEIDTNAFIFATEPSAVAEAVEMFVVDDKSAASGAQTGTFVFSAEPLKVDGAAITLDGDVKVISDDASESKVNVILKTDDSSVSVAADSIDGAIKKINDQIKALKEKGGSSNKDKAQVEALAKIAKQLADIAKSNKTSVTSGDGKIQHRVVIRNVENAKITPDSPEKKADIEKARAKIKELSKALAAAQADLAKLEGRPVHGFTFTTPGHFETHGNQEFKVMALPKLSQDNMNVIVRKKVEGATAEALKAGKAEVLIKKIEPKFSVGVAPKREVQVRALKVPPGGEDRIKSLEKKLDQLLEEVANLKKSKGD